MSDAKPPEEGAPATAPHPPNGESLTTYQREGPVGPRAGRRCSTAAGSVAPAAQRLAHGSRLPLPPGGVVSFVHREGRVRRHAGSNRILEIELKDTQRCSLPSKFTHEICHHKPLLRMRGLVLTCRLPAPPPRFFTPPPSPINLA